MASPAKKTAEERQDTDYDRGTSGSEAGTPKKGRKKKETPDPGLTLGTDIEDHLKPDGRQVEVELDNVRIDQEKTKGQTRRKDTKLLQKRIVGCSVLGRGAEPLVRTQFLEHPPTLNFGANHLKKWIQHPQKPPIPFLSPHNPHHGGGFWGGGGQRVRAQLEQS